MTILQGTVGYHFITMRLSQQHLNDDKRLHLIAYSIMGNWSLSEPGTVIYCIELSDSLHRPTNEIWVFYGTPFMLFFYP